MNIHQLNLRPGSNDCIFIFTKLYKLYIASGIHRMLVNEISLNNFTKKDHLTFNDIINTIFTLQSIIYFFYYKTIYQILLS